MPFTPPNRCAFASSLEVRFREQTNPAYPEEARDEHLSGPVVLEAVIGTDGSVKEVKPLNGPAILVPDKSVWAQRQRIDLVRELLAASRHYT